MINMRPWKTSFFAVLCSTTLAVAGFALSLPVIPLFLEEDIGVTDPVKLKAWVGIIQAGAAVSQAIFTVIWGYLADKIGRRIMLLRVMFGGAAMFSMIAFAQSPWQLFVLRTIQGAVTGTTAAAIMMVAAITPAAKIAFALGLLQTSVAIGNSIGPLAGGFLSDMLGHRVSFFATGFMLAGAGLLILKFVDKDTPPAGTPADSSSFAKSDITKSDKPLAKSSFFSNLRRAFSSPVLPTLMFVTFAVNASINFVTPMLPIFLKELAAAANIEARFIGSSTGLVLGVSAAAMAIAAVVAGKYAARVGYRRILVFCSGAAALFSLPQMFVTNVIQLTILRAFSSFFIGGTIPVVSAIIAMYIDKKHQGLAYGINQSMNNTGSAFGPLLGAAIAVVNMRLSFLAAALIMVIATVIAARGLRRGNLTIGK